MKHLGIDIGSVYTGFAISDIEGSLAFPFRVEQISDTQKLFKKILEIIETEEIQKVVLGESESGTSQKNSISDTIAYIHKKLVDQNISVELQNEFASTAYTKSLDSFFAQQPKGNISNKKKTSRSSASANNRKDAQAAAIILQRFLDANKS